MESERSTIRVLNELSGFELEEFDDRLRLQKLVFLAKKIGYDFGYTFSWYARGPYSPSLTRMLFSANEQNRLNRDDVELNDYEIEVVDALRTFLNDDIENPRALELLASVWYFLRNRRYSPEERNALIATILQRKPQFERDEVEEAVNRIQRYRDH